MTEIDIQESNDIQELHDEMQKQFSVDEDAEKELSDGFDHLLFFEHPGNNLFVETFENALRMNNLNCKYIFRFESKEDLDKAGEIYEQVIDITNKKKVKKVQKH